MWYIDDSSLFLSWLDVILFLHVLRWGLFLFGPYEASYPFGGIFILAKFVLAIPLEAFLCGKIISLPVDDML
jgi:hypothetical protein